MRIAVRHTITWQYTPQIQGASYALRLEPPAHARQRVQHWRIVDDQGGTLSRSTDGYGNIVHMLAVNRPHQALTVLSAGEVETIGGDGTLHAIAETLPAVYFLRTTETTPASAALQSMAAAVADIRDGRERLDLLLLAVRKAMAHATPVDIVHGFVAAARLLGHPARVVSGYLAAETAQGAHFWAEAYSEGAGWTGFDPATGLVPAETHLRVAIGLDAGEAAAVRSARRGFAEETLAMDLWVQQVQAGQQ
jgi:transglutaminase-like putative cysteine protease